MATPSILIVPDRYKSGVLYSQLPESGAVDFDVTRATTAYRTNASGVLESVASGVPRLDYPAAGGCPALLVEPAATNLFQNSGWAGGGVPPSGWAQPFSTGTASAATSTLNPSASAYLFTTAGTRMVFSQNISQTSGTVYTLSVYVEQVISGSLTVGNLIGYNFSVAGIATYLEDGVVVADSTAVQSGKRYSLRLAAPSTASVQSRVGNGIGAVATASVRLSMPQIEIGSVATSFILSPIGSTATRNADVISKTGVSGFIGQSVGTIYADVNISSAKTATSHPITLWSAAVNRLQFFINSSNQLSFQAVLGGIVVLQITTTVQPIVGINKIAVGYQSGNTSLYLNGASIGSSSSSFSVPPCDSINLGSSAAGTNQLNDHIRCAAIYKERLTNAELAALTTL